MAGEDSSRRHSRAGSSRGAAGETENRIPISLCAQVGEPFQAERIAAGDDRACCGTEDSARESGCGCGCSVVVVNGRWHLAFAGYFITAPVNGSGTNVRISIKSARRSEEHTSEL